MASMYGQPLLQSRTISDTHRYGVLLVALGLLVYPASVLWADEIYKSVDSEGHVVYSDRTDGSPGQQSVASVDARTRPT